MHWSNACYDKGGATFANKYIACTFDWIKSVNDNERILIKCLVNKVFRSHALLILLASLIMIGSPA